MQKSVLYIVSTPIGNLGDITIRALETLKNSSLILCENIRISQKLLLKYNINSKLDQYNDYSDQIKRKKIIDLIKSGKTVSLISDAGTPLISDPGYKLVQELTEQGGEIDVIPGVSSPIAALTISRMPVDRFLFAGFIPKTEIAKINFFQELLHITATLIFFESPNRLLHSLRILADISPTRLCCVVRELTKMHQEVKFAPVSELLKFYQHQDLLGKKIKGEVILLVAGAARSEVLGNNEESIEHQLNKYLVQELRVGQGVRLISHRAYQKFNSIYSKKQIYKIAVSLQEQLKTQDN